MSHPAPDPGQCPGEADEAGKFVGVPSLSPPLVIEMLLPPS